MAGFTSLPSTFLACFCSILSQFVETEFWSRDKQSFKFFVRQFLIFSHPILNEDKAPKPPDLSPNTEAAA